MLVLNRARRRVSGVLVLLLALLLSGCSASGHTGAAPPSAAGTATGVSMTKQTDPAFTLRYPTTWTYLEGTGQYGIYNNFIGPRGHGGFEQAVLVVTPVSSSGVMLPGFRARRGGRGSC